MADTVSLPGACCAPEHSKEDESDCEMKASLPDVISESDNAPEFDFSEGLNLASLPSLVLVTVFRMLSVGDRYRLSMVCKDFNDLFYYPSVWTDAVLNFFNDDTEHFIGSPSRLSENQKTMAAKFGHYFEDVTLHVSGPLVSFDDSTQQLLSQLNDKWRLRTLRLRVGNIVQGSVLTWFDGNSHLSPVLDIVRKADKLKRLDLIVWPLNVDGSLENVLKSVTSVELRSVNFFCQVLDDWYGSVSCVNHPVPVMDFVSRLNSLQCLCIQDNMLSNGLLHGLASSRYCQLKTMSIQVHTTQNKEKQVSAAAWSELRAARPCLEVFITLVARSSDLFFSRLFKPEIPLSSVTVHRYSRCSTSLLKLLGVYTHSLKSLVCYTAEDHCEQALIDLVKDCPHVQHLIFLGKIHSAGIEALAALSNQRKWKMFQFKEDNIITQPHVREESCDDDTVVKNVNGELVAVSMNNYLEEQSETEEERDSRLQRLKDEVSLNVGYEWNPDA